MGYPAYIAPDMDVITTSGKAVVFGDFSMYASAEREGVTLSRNPYLYQANGQVEPIRQAALWWCLSFRPSPSNT